MKSRYIFQIFKSNYCRLVFIISLAVVSAVIPKKIFYSYFIIIGILFIIASSLLITCFVRNIKDKAVIARKHKGSLLGIFFSIIGLVAMNTCTVGAPVCGTSATLGLVAVLFPGVSLGLLEQYSILIILISLAVQILVLYYMKCFRISVGKHV